MFASEAWAALPLQVLRSPSRFPFHLLLGQLLIVRVPSCIGLSFYHSF